MNAINIALSGLQASVARLDASASNIANIDSTGGGGAKPYAPVEIRQANAAGGGVATLAGFRMPSAFPIYDASSSAADASGMVESPNVDPVTETVDQIQALSAYRSNLSVIRTADEMEGALLDLKA